MWSVAQEIKSMATANVAGTIFEKVFYKTVVAFAVTLFISNSCFVIHSAATEKVTDIKVTAVDTIPFPALWMCAPREIYAKYSFDLEKDFCKSGSSVGEVLFLSKRFGEIKPKALTCSNSMSKPDHDIIKGLRAFMNSTYGGQSECVLIQDPSHVASRGEFQKLAFHIKSNVAAKHQHENNPGIVMGVLDGTNAWAEQQESFGQGFLVLDPFSSVSEVKFSMDKYVDVPFRMFGLGGEAKTVRSYHSTSSSSRVVAVNKPGVVSSYIYVSAGSFVTREITSRYKTFSQVCAEIGGLWAISVMVVTAFFVGKTVQGKEQTDPSVPVQVFRLRGVSSQKEAVKEIALMLRDTKNAVQENAAVTSDRRVS